MISPPEFCELCGLPLRYQKITSTTHGKTFYFCCIGCKQVFQMLMEATDSPDPDSFRETELFMRCQEIGIIPSSEDDLVERAGSQELEAAARKPRVSVREDEYQKSDVNEVTLSLNLQVNQMWCPACAWVIEETLRRTSGIIGASCNFATDRVRCDYDPVLTSPQRIIDSLCCLRLANHECNDALLCPLFRFFYRVLA